MVTARGDRLGDSSTRVNPTAPGRVESSRCSLSGGSDTVWVRFIAVHRLGLKNWLV